MAETRAIVKLAHHEQEELCRTRPPYRQGKKLTAVKVYTVNDESQHVMICGVPKLQLSEEIKRLVSPYGAVKRIKVVPDYPTEEFTEAFHVQYARIQSARIAKRLIDCKNFYGGLLHVFYAPELETAVETRAKLIQRRKDVAVRIKRHQEDPTNPETDEFLPKEQYHRRKKTPALPLTEERLSQTNPGESLVSIYDGIPRHIDRRPIAEPSLPGNWVKPQDHEPTPCPELLRAPYQPTDTILRAAGVRDSRVIPNEALAAKRKNYRGRSFRESTKVRIIRPQLLDTRNMAKTDDTTEKTVFSKVKKVESGITIKLLPKQQNDGRKRIVIKNPSTVQLVQPTQNLQASIQAVKSQIREAMQRK